MCLLTLTSKRILSLGVAFIWAFVTMPAAEAGISSSQYAIDESLISGGGGNGQSSNYTVQSSRFVMMDSGTQSSTNFRINAGGGIDLGNKIPAIQGITPSGFTRFFTDQQASYAVTASSPDGDTLQYRARQDASVKAGPQTSSTLSWQLTSADQGRHTVALEAIDPQGTVGQTHSLYVFRRPVK